MILTYKTGEPVWLGDHVLAAGTPAVIRSFTWNKDYSVRLYIENISGKSLSTIDVIPEDNRSLLPADTSVACDSEWKNVSFLKRGEIRYVTSGVPVKVGDVVAVEQSFGLMKLCQISEIVYGKRQEGEIVAADGTSIKNTGCFVTDKIWGNTKFSTLEILDDRDFLSDEWEHVYFVRRGNLTPPERPKDRMLQELWDNLFKTP